FQVRNCGKIYDQGKGCGRQTPPHPDNSSTARSKCPCRRSTQIPRSPNLLEPSVNIFHIFPVRPHANCGMVGSPHDMVGAKGNKLRNGLTAQCYRNGADLLHFLQNFGGFESSLFSCDDHSYLPSSKLKYTLPIL